MSLDETTHRLLTQLVETRPEDWEARSHLATLLLDAGRHAEAIALLEAAPSAPPDPAAALLVGRALGGVDVSRAIEHYQAMLDADRRCAPAHLALAELFRERGLREEARQHYGIAVVLDEALEDPAFDDWIHGTTSARGSSAAAEAGAPEASAPEPSAGDAEENPPSAAELQDTLDLDAPPPATDRITFDDVGGMEDVKEQVRMRVVYPFRNPALFKRFKKRPGGGILLYGPPGCGKTHLARATAGECGARFVAITLSDVLSRWLGESEQRLAALFQEARRRAPTVIFVDEFDALGMSRRHARGSALQTIINQLLTELDGIGRSNDGVLVLAATNAPWAVDPAFRRPGRFDRIVFVPPPDRQARAEILSLALADLPTKGVDPAKLAARSRGFSGADLKEVVERAGDAAIQSEMRRGKPASITHAMLAKELKAVRPTTQEWLDTARNYASFANRAGQYDDIADFFETDSD